MLSLARVPGIQAMPSLLRAAPNPSPLPPAFRRALVLLALLALAGQAAGAAKSIVLTHVPAIRQSVDKTLAGRIYGIDPATVRIALYIQVGEAWWTKPSFSKPLTAIAADGSWSATIAPVASDTSATQIVALVVPAGFVPPDVAGEPWLPDTVTQAALASVAVVRPDPLRHSFHWSGHDWAVRDSGGQRQGPGDNLFSPSNANVFVDAAGLLHLRITGSATTWDCAELQLYRPLGYGRYRFRTANACDPLDANAVLGLFTWSDGTADPNYREIDIEWSRWGEPRDPTNAQFVVQPYEPAGHRQRITIPAAVTELAQEFTWRTTGVDFLATGAGYSAAWSYPPAGTASPNLPESRDERIHLNLWLNRNTGPRNGQPVEVVLRSFSFQGVDTDGDGVPDAWERAHGLEPAVATDALRDDDGDGATNLDEYLAGTDPADAASAFRITRYTRSGTTHELTFTARPDRLYDIETSATLAAAPWATAITGLSGSSATITTALPDPGQAPHAFYRVRIQPQP
ncbi:MAG: glycoside hydrolase family 16 protein [Opitutaceae bacterium]|nr:glycoside hydrolase family 16 protein [Opitutaceae bacterium]